MDHWSKPIAVRAGSVLARMFRYGGTIWHPLAPAVMTAPSGPHRKGLRCPTGDRGLSAAVTANRAQHGGSSTEFPQAVA
jgi:hypothetical protein